MTLSLRGNSIPIDGSGRIVITDINPDEDNDEDALICRSQILSDGSNWYLHPTQQTTGDSDRIESERDNTGTDPRGWIRSRAAIRMGNTGHYRLVRLRRDDRAASGDRALEGVFTCHIPGDSNTPVSVGIYYPSESHRVSFTLATRLAIVVYFIYCIHAFVFSKYQLISVK